MASAEIRSLTGLRGAAAMAVVGSHLITSAPYATPLERMAHHGYMAVDLFFCLSGFVMALTYCKPDRPLEYLAFLQHRLARIYPLYFIITAMVIALGISTGASWPIPTIIANIFLIQTWGVSESILNTAWSISVELLAYVTFPLTMAWVLRGSWRLCIGIAITAAGALILLGAAPHLPLWPKDQPEFGPFARTSYTSIAPVVRGLSGFVLGAATWRLWSGWRPQLPAWTGSALLAFALAASTFARGDVAMALMMPAMVFCVAQRRDWLARALASPIPYFLGTISYSIYLIHQQIINLHDSLKQMLDISGRGGVVIAGLEVVLILAASWATFYLIERRARVFGRRLGQKAQAGMLA